MKTEISKRRASAERTIDMLVGKDAAPTWWASPNRAFNGLTPDEMWITDEERVCSYILAALMR